MAAPHAQCLIAFEQPDGTFAILYNEPMFDNAWGADQHIVDLKVADHRAGRQEPHRYIIIDIPIGWHYGPKQ